MAKLLCMNLFYARTSIRSKNFKYKNEVQRMIQHNEVRARKQVSTVELRKYLEEENVKFVAKSIDAENITNASINYAKTIDADIIVIMTEQEMTTSNLFLGAFAQQMVNHSPIPVLNIHAKEFIKISSR